MTIYLNNEQVVLSEEASLQALMEEKGLSQKKGIAVAVNNKVINAASWASQQLSENDKVLVISATQGG